MGRPGTGVVLIGLRRAGKTSVGRALAAALARPFVDTDAEVSRLEGLTPERILLERGEAGFRKAECRAVEQATRTEGAVISAGGGAPLHRGNRRLLGRHGTVIYLRVGVPELLKRLEEDPTPRSRPLLAGRDKREEVILLHRQRDPLYERWAEHVVDGSGTVAQVAGRCLEALRSPGR